MHVMTKPHRGGCLCGVVKFEVDEFLPEIAHCHCSMCRKFHGAAFATIAGVSRSHFRWIEGEEALTAYRAENGTTRTFCRHCGSSLMFSSPRASPEIVEIALGAVHGDIPVKPNAHIFVGSKASWTEFGDGLPLYEKGRDSPRIKR